MSSTAVRFLLAMPVLCLTAAVAAAEAAVTAGASALLFAAKKDDSWWKTALEWLDRYASSKVGMIQIGVLAVLFSLYIITRKDGPK